MKSLGNKRDSRDKSYSGDKEQREKASIAEAAELWRVRAQCRGCRMRRSGCGQPDTVGAWQVVMMSLTLILNAEGSHREFKAREEYNFINVAGLANKYDGNSIESLRVILCDNGPCPCYDVNILCLVGS